MDLQFSNIENHPKSSAPSQGFALTGSLLAGGMGGLLGGVLGAQVGDEAGGTTRAAVSAGRIAVRSDEGSGKDSTAGLSRDTAHANQTVENTFNLQRIQNDLALSQVFGRTATFAMAEVSERLAAGSPEMAALFKEGGVGRGAMHVAVAAMGAAISGGNLGAAVAGDALPRLAQPIIEQAVAQLPVEAQVSVRNALNAVVAAGGGAVGGGLVAGAGGAVGGMGAGSNNEVYNRQLHVDKDPYRDERTLAKQLADKSGGRYTQVQVEEQLRIMGVSTNGQHESGAPDTLIGQAPMDAGAGWIYSGTTVDGKPILTQVTAQADPQLQAYILANANSAAPNEAPSVFQYDRSPNNRWGFSVTGPFTQFNKVDADFMRSTTADAASMVSTNAGRFSAASGAAAAIPSPYALGFAAAAFGGTVLGYGANIVEQLVRPNPIEFSVDSTVDLLLYRPAERFPLWGPAINEMGNSIKNSDWLNQLKGKGDPKE